MTEPVYSIVDAYLKPDTKIQHGLDRLDAGKPCVWVRTGRFPYSVALFFATVDDIDRFSRTLADARQDLAEAQGFLPNGEPCEYADEFGSPLWHDHDHDACLRDGSEAGPTDKVDNVDDADDAPIPYDLVEGAS